MHEATEGICRCGKAGASRLAVMVQDHARDSVRVALLVAKEASRRAGVEASLSSLLAVSALRQGA